jgi:aspartyl/asparaginyl beta-hydroxylase (cupin superfamily)
MKVDNLYHDIVSSPPMTNCTIMKTTLTGPKSGIKPHSDKNNFIITFHVGLDVPEGECYIQVGNEKHYWKVNEI